MSSQVLLYSTLNGAFTSLGVNVLAYTAHLEKSGRRTFTPAQRTCFLLINTALALTGVGFFLIACRHGAVAMAMPISCASTLFFNMLMQMSMSVKRYTKSMLVGTLMLVFAIAMLIDVGPKDQKIDDPIKLLMSSPSVICTVAQLALLIIGLWSAYALRSTEPSFIGKIFAYAAIVSASTVISASLGKLMQLPGLNMGLRVLVLCLYLVLGVFSIGGSGAAGASTDVSLFVPINYCLQLVVNCIAGLCIWQDGKVIDNRIGYVMVYCLVVLGVYEVSSFDLLTTLAIRRMLYGMKLSSENVAARPFGRALQQLTKLWQECPQNEAETSIAFREVIERGLHDGMLDLHEVVELVMVLATKYHETGPSPTILQWLQQHVQNYQLYAAIDPQWDQMLREVTFSSTPEESQELGQSSSVSPEEQQQQQQRPWPLRTSTAQLSGWHQVQGHKARGSAADVLLPVDMRADASS